MGMSDSSEDLIAPDVAGCRDAAGRWTAGTSGNPAGRPRGLGSIVTELRRLAVERDEQGITPAHRIAAELIRLAEAGDLRAIREVMDRLDGAPARAVVDIEPQRIELRPITFERRD